MFSGTQITKYIVDFTLGDLIVLRDNMVRAFIRGQQFSQVLVSNKCLYVRVEMVDSRENVSKFYIDNSEIIWKVSPNEIFWLYDEAQSKTAEATSSKPIPIQTLHIDYNELQLCVKPEFVMEPED